MAEYVLLEKTIRDKVNANPFTRIMGLPTWMQSMRLLEEMASIAMECDVSYDWAEDYGLLALVDGPEKYLS